MTNIKVTSMYDTFKATYYRNDKEGMVILYRKNSNGEFHRAIKIKKKELMELASLIKESDNAI